MASDTVVIAEVIAVNKRGDASADVTIRATVGGRRLSGVFWARSAASYPKGKKVKAVIRGRRLILANTV